MTKRNAVAFEALDKAERRKAGAYQFMYRYDVEAGRNTDQRVGIRHACPCGCGAEGVIWFKGGSLNGSGNAPDHEWNVVGDWPKVTLSPSIGFAKSTTTGQYHWHGYLTKGVFEEC